MAAAEAAAAAEEEERRKRVEDSLRIYMVRATKGSDVSTLALQLKRFLGRIIECDIFEIYLRSPILLSISVGRMWGPADTEACLISSWLCFSPVSSPPRSGRRHSGYESRSRCMPDKTC